jgi:hypothetical protein
MPTRYIPISDDEQKLAGVIERIFKDQNFARAMESNPAQALESAGYKLTQHEKDSLKQAPQVVRAAGTEDAIHLAAFVRPVVSIITRGTRPAVSVVTKGTQPVVSVVTGTVVAVQEAKAPHLMESAEEEKKQS